MRPEEIRRRLRARPFQAIRVVVSDGSFRDVRHPEFMYVAQQAVIIGLNPSRMHVLLRSADLDPMRITRIEPIDGGAPATQT